MSDSNDQVTDGRFAPPPFAFVQAKDLLSKPEPIPWLIEGMIEQGSLVTLFGPTESYKSFQTIDWACCIATGTPWKGKPVVQGAVFYIAGEGQAGLKRRLRAWELGNRVSLADAPLFVSTCPAALMNDAHAKAVAQEVARLADLHGPPMLITVDTLARNLGAGNEDSNADISAFINNIDRRLRAPPLGAAVVIVHHTGLHDKERARGASALRAAMDAEYRLMKMEGGAGELTCTKAKEWERPPPMYFSLMQVVLDGWTNEHGELMTSAVLVPATTALKVTKSTGMSPAEKIALSALVEVLTARGQPPAEALVASVSTAPTKVATEGDWRQHAYRKGISTSAKPDALRKAFGRSRDSLVEAGKVEMHDGYCWLSEAT